MKSGEYEIMVNFPVGIRKRQLSFKSEDESEKVEKVLVNDKEVNFRWEKGYIIFTIEDMMPYTLENKLHVSIRNRLTN